MNNVQRYSEYGTAEANDAFTWIHRLSPREWIGKFELSTECGVISTAGVPQLVILMLCRQIKAIESMSDSELQNYLREESVENRVKMVDAAVARAGR
jgi:hypothetical protein